MIKIIIGTNCNEATCSTCWQPWATFTFGWWSADRSVAWLPGHWRRAGIVCFFLQGDSLIHSIARFESGYFTDPAARGRNLDRRILLPRRKRVLWLMFQFSRGKKCICQILIILVNRPLKLTRLHILRKTNWAVVWFTSLPKMADKELWPEAPPTWGNF